MTSLPYSPLRLLARAQTMTGQIQRLGLLMLGVIVFMALAAPVLTPFASNQLACAPFEAPNLMHPLGCDDAGHDLWAQLLYGGRVSLLIGLSVAVVSTAIATGLALVAGLSGVFTDRVLMRLVDVVLALPFLPLVIVLGVYFGASLYTQIIVIVAVMWASPLRELRAQVLALRNAGFVEASRAMGAGTWFIGLRHVLPELAPMIVPQFIRIAHAAILVETSLAFLGLGDPLQDSWGTILFHANARAAFLTGAWVYWIMPAGLAISLTVLSLAFIGYGYDGKVMPRFGKRRAVTPISSLTAKPLPDMALEARDMRVSYDSPNGLIPAVKGISLALPKGQMIGLVGESGSGKTTAALAMLRLLRPPAYQTHGSVWLQEADLLALDTMGLTALRGRRLALIPQSAMNALNPVLTIGAQLDEALSTRDLKPSARKSEALRWLGLVGLGPEHYKAYAHMLSGGMRQRAVIALALCNLPEVVIADEPTTGLDVLVQQEIMALLLDLSARLGLSVLFVTHNLPLIARHANQLAVMYQGQIVEFGRPDDLVRSARHPHSRALFDNLPELSGEKRWNSGQEASSAPLIFDVQSATCSFGTAGLAFWRKIAPKPALKEVSLQLRVGEKLGLVGGSGAGKSTIARLLMGMQCLDRGQVFYHGQPMESLGQGARKTMAQAVHMVFQDPYNSLRASLSIAEILAEPLRIQNLCGRGDYGMKIKAALRAVHLPDDDGFLARRPAQLSGGQRQRLAFARALVTDPQVIIADEPTSMLDQSVRMEIMDLMEEMRRTRGTSFVFITHDIALARHFCDRLIVLCQGEIVEQGPTDQVIDQPSHAYTRRLLAAV